jgi:hypothetical protein
MVSAVVASSQKTFQNLRRRFIREHSRRNKTTMLTDLNHPPQTSGKSGSFQHLPSRKLKNTFWDGIPHAEKRTPEVFPDNPHVR